MGRSMERIVLGAAALVLLGVGLGGLAAPAAFYAGYGITVVGDIGLSSELRAVGAALLSAGMAVAVGVVSARSALASAVVGAGVLLAFALGRLVSLAVDGPPAPAILAAAVVEAALGAAAAWVAARRRRVERRPSTRAHLTAR